MKKRKTAISLLAACGAAVILGGCSTGTSDGKTHLTFQIWDIAQRDGTRALF